ncbi:glycine betaine ABC transporter substrate-binding protein [Actinomycetospora atypica]|uniref:Glycine betaine ABC transporter substrate-binding protein n=1 Tax=Actinomycetospora atypica TaxID=1290095 RepID=A0ABV9YMD2_9PSEU
MRLLPTAPAPAVPAVVVPLVLLAVVVLGGCGATPLRSPDASGGLFAGRADLRGAGYVVGGGPRTPLRLLCQMTIAAVQAAGGNATDECGKVGGADVRQVGESDVDTGWASLRTLGPDGSPTVDGEPADPPADLAVVRARDAARGVTWLPPTAFGDTDVVVARTPGPLSGLAASPVPTTLCAPPRAVPGTAATPGTGAVLAAYGPWTTTVLPMDTAAVLAGVATGRCTAGIVPGSSGRVPALGLAVLDDDRGALTGAPPGPRGYAPLLRTGLLEGRPAMAGLLGEITRRLDGPAMRGMVREVEVDGRDPRDVARRWLLAQGLIATG